MGEELHQSNMYMHSQTSSQARLNSTCQKPSDRRASVLHCFNSLHTFLKLQACSATECNFSDEKNKNKIKLP